MILEIFMGIVLVLGSVYDRKYYSVPVRLLVVGMLIGMVGIGYKIFGGSLEGEGVVLALLPGVVVLLLAYASREQIGYGDGILLLAMGGCLSLKQMMWTVFGALAGTFVISCILLLTGKAKATKRLPFVPFLLMGYIVVMLGRGWSG